MANLSQIKGFIIAGNYTEYRQLCEDHVFSEKQWPYLAREHQLRDLDFPPKIKLYGTWYKIHQVRDLLKLAKELGCYVSVFDPHMNDRPFWMQREKDELRQEDDDEENRY